MSRRNIACYVLTLHFREHTFTGNIFREEPISCQKLRPELRPELRSGWIMFIARNLFHHKLVETPGRASNFF